MSLALEILREIKTKEHRPPVEPKKRSRTHCKYGHLRTPENTYRFAAGYKVCATCSRAANRRWYWQDEERKKCGLCGTPIKRNNKSGLCNFHLGKYRMFIGRTVRLCGEPGCLKMIQKSSHGYCRQHSKKRHNGNYYQKTKRKAA